MRNSSSYFVFSVVWCVTNRRWHKCKLYLDELYSQYKRFVPDSDFLREIENAHQQLRQSLEKSERKLVLRIIDNKDLIASERGKESFQCGFWLAWRLFSELHTYNGGRSLEKFLNVDGRFAVAEEKTENALQA